VRRRKFRLVHEAARQLNTALGPWVRLNVCTRSRTAWDSRKRWRTAVGGQNVRSEQIARLGRGSIARVLRRSMRPP
jgi:hypothetical protein